jgi:hypothetical protein
MSDTWRMAFQLGAEVPAVRGARILVVDGETAHLRDRRCHEP